ncbi:MAG: hypothetical protein WAV89_12645 [Ignavibacteriaceae bacterium]
MKKQITQIRDINEIEKLIQGSSTGVLSIHLANEKIMQLACNFVYLDKNIYTFLDNTDENFEHIKYGSAGSFSIFKNERINTIASEFTYKLSHITINGEIKDIDDIKLIDQITELYRLKYSSVAKVEDYKLSENLKPIILDSKEIKSVIEEGI